MQHSLSKFTLKGLWVQLIPHSDTFTLLYQNPAEHKVYKFIVTADWLLQQLHMESCKVQELYEMMQRDLDDQKNELFLLFNTVLTYTPHFVSREISREVTLKFCGEKLEGVNPIYSQTSTQSLKRIFESEWWISGKDWPESEFKIEILDKEVENLDDVYALVKRSAKVTTFKMDLTGEKNRWNDDLAIEVFKIMKNFGKLEILDLGFKTSTITDFTLKVLSDMLLKVTSMKGLLMEFHSCDNLGESGLTELFMAFQKLTKITRFALTLSYINITNEKLYEMLFTFEKMKMLGTLRLKLEGQGIKDSHIKLLSNSLQKTTSLKSLILYLPGSKITGVGMLDLATGIESLPLQLLYLDFTWCQGLNDQAAVILANSLDKMAKNLTYLDLYFSNTSITNKGMNSLTSSISTLTKLKKFVLVSPHKDIITEDSINFLFNKLEGLQALNILNLDFAYCKPIGDSRLKYLSISLSKFTSIRFLDLNFYFCEFDDEDFLRLQYAISNLTTIEGITLDLGWNLISSISVQKLWTNLAKLSLKKLSLSFDKSECLEEDLFKGMNVGLMNQKNLKNLQLSFQDCKLLKETCLADLSSGLEKVLKLEILSLNFSKCTNFAMKESSAFFTLANTLAKMAAITNLTLDFSDTGIEKIECEKIFASLKKLSTMKKLKLGMDGVAELDRKEVEKFVENWNLVK